ncbi:MAG TPA: hypothetical protein VGE63_02620 [Candidatus Paceibacterota bacterium]
MHHVAIMTKSWGLIPKILNGQKTIESRWYQTKRTPWNNVQVGDTVYFKNSGERVAAQATVAKVLQFEIADLATARAIIKTYGKDICLVNTDPAAWSRLPKYCILIFLSNPKSIKTFSIDKTGFGAGAAWITVKNISSIKL